MGGFDEMQIHRRPPTKTSQTLQSFRIRAATPSRPSHAPPRYYHLVTMESGFRSLYLLSRKMLDTAGLSETPDYNTYFWLARDSGGIGARLPLGSVGCHL